MFRLRSLIIPVSAAVFFIAVAAIKGRLPENILYFADIGTYNVPTDTVEVNASEPVAQSFVSNFDNLMMVSVYVAAQPSAKERHLIFRLFGKADNKELAHLEWEYSQIKAKEHDFYVVHPARASDKDGFHFHIPVPIVEGSKNKEFYFYFESPDAAPKEGILLGFWGRRRHYDALTQGAAFVNGRPVEGFFAFRTFNTWRATPRELLARIKSRLTGDRVFVLFWLVSLVFMSVILLTTFIPGGAQLKKR